MRKIVTSLLGAIALFSVCIVCGGSGLAQAPGEQRAPRTGREEVGQPATALYTLEDGLLR
jgi:hypothetical protein